MDVDPAIRHPDGLHRFSEHNVTALRTPTRLKVWKQVTIGRAESGSCEPSPVELVSADSRIIRKKCGQMWPERHFDRGRNLGTGTTNALENLCGIDRGQALDDPS